MGALTPPILGLVLLAAVAHAAWNLLAKGAQGGPGFVWLYTVAASVLYLPVLVVGAGDRAWAARLRAFVFMAGSGALHTVYSSLLQRGYATGDLSLVYPLARGTGPADLDASRRSRCSASAPAPLALAGAGLIVGAVLALAPAGARGRAARTGPRRRRRAIGFAL